MATFTVLVGIGIFFFFFSGEEAPRAGAVLPLRKQSEDGGLAQLLSEDSEFHFHYFLFQGANSLRVGLVPNSIGNGGRVLYTIISVLGR